MDTDNVALSPLSRFHPIIAHWFRDRYKCPTDIQSEAWGYIQARQHVLVIAPTGSGKTLTAFLWAINELASAKLPLGQTRILYVSPLKALNNDIKRNLLQPLEELKLCFNQARQEMLEICVLTRSGDTPFTERRQMLRRPPEILITTPESLNLLLTSPQARTTLSTVRTLILDEIHSVFDSKRGTYLMTAVERLVLLAVESYLKDGRLKAIVATNSLELGIDIGPLDEVLLVQSSPSMSAAIQCIDRAGHQVGQISRGSI